MRILNFHTSWDQAYIPIIQITWNDMVFYNINISTLIKPSMHICPKIIKTNLTHHQKKLKTKIRWNQKINNKPSKLKTKDKRTGEGKETYLGHVVTPRSVSLGWVGFFSTFTPNVLVAIGVSSGRKELISFGPDAVNLRDRYRGTTITSIRDKEM